MWGKWMRHIGNLWENDGTLWFLAEKKHRFWLLIYSLPYNLPVRMFQPILRGCFGCEGVWAASRIASKWPEGGVELFGSNSSCSLLKHDCFPQKTSKFWQSFFSAYHSMSKYQCCSINFFRYHDIMGKCYYMWIIPQTYIHHYPSPNFQLPVLVWTYPLVI